MHIFMIFWKFRNPDLKNLKFEKIGFCQPNCLFENVTSSRTTVTHENHRLISKKIFFWILGLNNNKFIKNGARPSEKGRSPKGRAPRVFHGARPWADTLFPHWLIEAHLEPHSLMYRPMLVKSQVWQIHRLGLKKWIPMKKSQNTKSIACEMI